MTESLDSYDKPLKKNQTRENPLLSLIFNIGLPTLILTKMSADGYLGPEKAFLVAMAMPLGYGLFDYFVRRELSWIAVLGFVSILIKGGLGLMKLDGIWFAVNEAALPGMLALGVMFARKYKPHVIRKILFNDKVLYTEKIEAKLDSEESKQIFERSLNSGSLWIGLSFVVSSILNFILAIYFLKSPAGTEAFNEELGVMTAASYPIIMVSSSSLLIYALISMAKTVRKLTGLTWEEIFRVDEKPKSKKTKDEKDEKN